jgi:hypothetical protein
MRAGALVQLGESAFVATVQAAPSWLVRCVVGAKPARVAGLGEAVVWVQRHETKLVFILDRPSSKWRRVRYR